MYGQDEWLSPARVQKPAYSPAPAGFDTSWNVDAPILKPSLAVGRNLSGQRSPEHGWDGKPFTRGYQDLDINRGKRPRDRTTLTLKSPQGKIEDVQLIAASQAIRGSRNISYIATTLFLPGFCFVLGFAVAAIRIRDPLASLLLALLLSFAEATHDSAWIWPARDAAIWLQGFLGDFFPVWMMLFGIYFPHRFRMDDRFPWAKWVVIAPFTLGSIANGLITMVWLHNIDAAIPFRPLFYAIFRTKYWLGVLAVTVFFHAMASRSFQERDKDARRRIALLWAGASAGLVPALGILVYALFTGQDPDFAKVPNRAGVSAIALMPLFPLTLAYVIVVQRAMNLRVVIRLGVKYALARHGLWILRAAFLSLPVYAAFRENLASGLVGLAVVLLVLQKAPTARVSEWLDRCSKR